MNYRNAQAEEDGIDPRKELEKFVIGNRRDLKENFFEKNFPDLNANDEENQLKEFVRTRNPYCVLESCFVAASRHDLVRQQLKVDPNMNLEGRELVGAMLEKLGFKKEVMPEGLFHISEKIKCDLKEAAGNTTLLPHKISGISNEMFHGMESLLPTLFLFQIYRLNELICAVTDVALRETSYENIEGLRRKWAKDGRLGSYPDLLEGLMDYALHLKKGNQIDDMFKLLNKNQIAQIGMFIQYRNLFIHSWQKKKWLGTQKNIKKYLSKMDDSIRDPWEENWNKVKVKVSDGDKELPRREMLQRMASFFERFLDLLSEYKIYPKVIVMHSYTVDEYGARQIAAVTDADETVFLTDSEFKPFTQFYYYSHTNPVGIDPLLVSKEELEGWATQSDENKEN